jgi:hypothetical protein
MQFGVADIGADSDLVSRHDAKGKHHSDDSLNTHVTVGHVTASLAALARVYGEELCAASLCSLRPGKFRLKVCDLAGQAGHQTLNGGAHKLPWKSGPNSTSWSEVTAFMKKKEALKTKKVPKGASKRKEAES